MIYIKGSRLLAVFALNYPESQNITVERLADADASKLPLFNGIIKNVSCLGFEEKIEYKRDEKGLHISTTNVSSPYPVVFKVELY